MLTRDRIAELREHDDGRPVIVAFARIDGIHIEIDEIEPLLRSLAVTFPTMRVDLTNEADGDSSVRIDRRHQRQFERLAALNGHRVSIFDDTDLN